MQPPVLSQLPSLEELACGNTAGLRPQTINKTLLDAARPLQQVAARLRGRTALPCRSWPGRSLLSCVQTCPTPMSTALHVL